MPLLCKKLHALKLTLSDLSAVDISDPLPSSGNTFSSWLSGTAFSCSFLYFFDHFLCVLRSYVLLCLALGCWFSVSPLAPYSRRRFIHSGGLHYVPKTPKLVPRVQLFLLSSLLPSLLLERLTGSLNV